MPQDCLSPLYLGTGPSDGLGFPLSPLKWQHVPRFKGPRFLLMGVGQWIELSIRKEQKYLENIVSPIPGPP